jgi:dipeptidyl aminopeptidase/acylaminoacyl peptidase
MGIQGHSFGGYEVNYLVTRTNMFAAAAEAAGASNLVSKYGSGGVNSQWISEEGQYRFGGTLWQKKEQYISNSPVLNSDKVQTPLLVMHNKEDDAVPFTQAVEWFTALRRLGKKVWLLQYDGHGHQLGGKAADDYTIRLTQFFDYYLKGAAPPIWLTKVRPAQLKGVDSGLELDISGQQP